MTFLEIKNRAMAQAGEDVDDLEEQEPYITNYANEGYHQLNVKRYGEVGAATMDPMAGDMDEPELPEWIHGAISDYATYRLLINGNLQRQSRAQIFLQMFENAKNRLMSEKEESAYTDGGGRLHMRNLYVPRRDL